MDMTKAEPTAIAILAKAPVAGFAKTRLIPALGADRAARLQARLTERIVDTACAASIGPITIWTSPDETHPTFQALRSRHDIALARQPDGDLGARMLAALAASTGPTLVVGADCPAMTPMHLRKAAKLLRNGCDAVIFPAEDGGYVLIGMRHPVPALFTKMPWSTDAVMAETRQRMRHHRLSWQEPATLWDVDRPEDLPRLRGLGLSDEFSH